MPTALKHALFATKRRIYTAILYKSTDRLFEAQEQANAYSQTPLWEGAGRSHRKGYFNFKSPT